MTTTANKSRIVDRQLATFEALRRFGFTPDELFTSWNGGSPITVIKAQGKTFVINYEPLTNTQVPATEAAYAAAWTQAAETWNNDLTDEEREAVYRKFIQLNTLVGLAVVLKQQGFFIPKLTS